jgi:hypothetical protein
LLAGLADAPLLLCQATTAAVGTVPQLESYSGATPKPPTLARLGSAPRCWAFLFCPEPATSCWRPTTALAISASVTVHQEGASILHRPSCKAVGNFTLIRNALLAYGLANADTAQGMRAQELYRLLGDAKEFGFAQEQQLLLRKVSRRQRARMPRAGA